MSEAWKTIRISGVDNIERVAGLYRVKSVTKFPYYAGVRIKVMERQDGSLYGVANMGVREKGSGKEHWAQGVGSTHEEVLTNLTKNLIELIDTHQAQDEEDFVWIADPRLF